MSALKTLVAATQWCMTLHSVSALPDTNWSAPCWAALTRSMLQPGLQLHQQSINVDYIACGLLCLQGIWQRRVESRLHPVEQDLLLNQDTKVCDKACGLIFRRSAACNAVKIDQHFACPGDQQGANRQSKHAVKTQIIMSMVLVFDPSSQ